MELVNESRAKRVQVDDDDMFDRLQVFCFSLYSVQPCLNDEKCTQIASNSSDFIIGKELVNLLDNNFV